ncbi:MAG: hypothetical protein ABI382_01575 [Nakamurella sp.]
MMVRKTLIAAVVAATLVATPVVAYAQGTETITGSPVVSSASTGTGTTATSSEGTATGSSNATTSERAGAKPGVGKHSKLRWLRDNRIRLSGVLHAQWTTKAKDGAVVTHDAIHGTASAVSSGSTSFTVTAADNTTQTYSASSATKVWKVTELSGKRRAVAAKLSDVASGSQVIVEGIGAGTSFTATRILVQLDK